MKKHKIKFKSIKRGILSIALCDNCYNSCSYHLVLLKDSLVICKDCLPELMTVIERGINEKEKNKKTSISNKGFV